LHDDARQWVNSPTRISERTEPGLEYKYNNTGYGLLALLVQRVTGRSFAEHMAATVFKPLGMTRTR
jgi:CubicO group peptidase (beta-lactamase class C family)